jgi:hypothetical protein
VQRDPLLFVDGPNVFEYCRSNPTNEWDPTGTSVLSGAADCLGEILMFKGIKQLIKLGAKKQAAKWVAKQLGKKVVFYAEVGYCLYKTISGGDDDGGGTGGGKEIPPPPEVPQTPLPPKGAPAPGSGTSPAPSPPSKSGGTSPAPSPPSKGGGTSPAPSPKK